MQIKYVSPEKKTVREEIVCVTMAEKRGKYYGI
jgi:hypothetical protein